MERLRVKSCQVRITFNLNEDSAITQQVRKLLAPHPIRAISRDFGSIEFELTEELVVPLLQVVGAIWELKGTQVILEEHVWTRRHLDLGGIKFKITSLFYRIALSYSKVADLDRFLICFKEALKNHPAPVTWENLALLLFLIGHMNLLIVKAKFTIRQPQTIRPRIAEAIAAFQTAMGLWNAKLFQMCCRQGLMGAQFYLGNRSAALRELRVTEQLGRDSNIDLDANLRKFGLNLEQFKTWLRNY